MEITDKFLKFSVNIWFIIDLRENPGLPSYKIFETILLL